MSVKFYSQNEENDFDESLNNYEFLFKNYNHYYHPENPNASNSPTLEQSLIELFRNSGASVNEAKEIYDDLYMICNNKIKENWEKIKQENDNVSKKDALIISSYTYEAKPIYYKYSPYRLINVNLVANDRKNGLRCIDKYFFLLLSSLRRLKKSKQTQLFRCITTKVKLEKDQINKKYVPYKVGNEKTFWTFTSTSDDEKIAENFLDNGKGTKYKIVGDDLWGYDLTLFNVFKEKEILLEPERRYLIENVKSNNDLIEVTCRIINNPKLLETIRKNIKVIVSKLFIYVINIIYSAR